ncbi:MAG: glutamate 5-kinase [bacterium]
MYKRIVVKVGTHLITDEKGIRKAFLKSFARQIASLYKKGREVIVVTSGAVGCGLKKLKMKKKALTLSEKQAVAAIGQIELMNEYKMLFQAEGLSTAQLLLTHDDVKDKVRNTNACNTIGKLLKWKVVPVINENDTVATQELKLGDNDKLAGIVGGMMKVDAVIILTSVDGVYDKNPHAHKDAKLITYIADVDKAMTQVNTEGKTELGTGGMLSKMEIGRYLNNIGIPLIIANGTKKNVLARIAEGHNEGTLISPKKRKS